MAKTVDVPNVGKVAVEKVADFSGMTEPASLEQETKKTIETIPLGKVGGIVATDPYSMEYLTTILVTSDTEYLGMVEKGDRWEIYFKKGKKN